MAGLIILQMLIIDGHLDLAYNALAYDRDQTLSMAELRQAEAAVKDSDGRGTATVCLEELRRGQVGLFVATLFTRAYAGTAAAQRLRRSDSDHATPAIAHAAAHGQLAYYRLLERQGLLRIITTTDELDAHWRQWHDAAATAVSGIPIPVSEPAIPVGCIILIEGADAVTEPAEIVHWHQRGVRAVSLAHTQVTAYASGNSVDGSLMPLGRPLLKAMAELNIVLDMSHLADRSFWEAMDHFEGRVLASHSNCRALAPGMRQFNDRQMRAIIERDGVVGVVLCNNMIVPGLKRETYQRAEVTLERLAEHVDHLCQLAGDAKHVGIGSDLDGGFGQEHTPAGIDTIADLQKLAPVLSKRGFRDDDIAAIMHENWLRFWREALSAE
ncbi:MAG: membrane dipeptidase [Phycisphaeraceae bacterium]